MNEGAKASHPRPMNQNIWKLYIEKVLQVILMQSQVEITAVEPHGLWRRKTNLSISGVGSMICRNHSKRSHFLTP